MRDHDALIAWLRARRDLPFAWGSNDCFRHAFGAVKAQTGRNLARELGARWTGKASALAELRRLGGVEAVLDRVLVRVPPAMAHRGDIGLTDGDGGPCLVVFEGETVAGVHPTGHVRLPRGVVLVAWSVEGRP